MAQMTRIGERKCHFGSQWQQISIRGLIFSVKSPVDLVGRLETHYRFPAYFSEESTQTISYTPDCAACNWKESFDKNKG
jgi:hypothetical protein